MPMIPINTQQSGEFYEIIYHSNFRIIINYNCMESDQISLLTMSLNILTLSIPSVVIYLTYKILIISVLLCGSKLIQKREGMMFSP